MTDTKKRMNRATISPLRPRRTYVLAILMSVALVGCSHKEYNYECLNGMYQVSVRDDTKDFITVTMDRYSTTEVDTTTEYKVALYSKTSTTLNATIYSYYFVLGKRSFMFIEPLNTMKYGEAECTKV